MATHMPDPQDSELAESVRVSKCGGKRCRDCRKRSDRCRKKSRHFLLERGSTSSTFLLLFAPHQHLTFAKLFLQAVAPATSTLFLFRLFSSVPAKAPLE